MGLAGGPSFESLKTEFGQNTEGGMGTIHLLIGDTKTEFGMKRGEVLLDGISKLLILWWTR